MAARFYLLVGNKAAPRRDWKRLSQTVCNVDLTFTTPDGSTSVTVKGIGSRHHIYLENEAEVVNSTNIHCSVHEDVLNDASYVTRENGEIKMSDHLVSFQDSKQITKTYRINEVHPDETVGMLVFILELYNA